MGGAHHGDVRESPQDAVAGRPVDQRDRAPDQPVEEHDQGVAAGAGPQRDAVPAATRAPEDRPLRGGAAAGAGDRCASAAPRAPHGPQAVRAAPGAGLPGQLRAGHRVRPRVARRPGRGVGALGLRAAEFRLGRSLPVRLERGRPRHRRRLAQGAAGAHEAVRVAGLLAGGAIRARATRCSSTRTRAA